MYSVLLLVSSVKVYGKAEKANKRKPRPRKLTDLEMNIQFLENKSSLVPIERKMLDSYKERQALLVDLSLSKATSSELNENPKPVNENNNFNENTRVESVSCSKPIRRKQAFASAFVLFKKEKLTQFKNENPQKKIDKDFCVDDWKNMTIVEKKVYHDKAALEKDKLGDAFRENIKSKSMGEAEKKESKKQANLKQRMMMQEDKMKRVNRENDCKQKYSNIIIKREEKLKALKLRGVLLSSQLSEEKVENSIILKLLRDKESQNVSLKEKYSALYKSHKNCNKKS